MVSKSTYRAIMGGGPIKKLPYLGGVPPGKKTRVGHSRKKPQKKAVVDRGRKKTFPFLTLPAELRQMVYAHVFAPCYRGYWPEKKCPKRKISDSMNILRLNRQIYLESAMILYSKSSFSFTIRSESRFPNAVEDMNWACNSPLNVEHLNEVDITVSASTLRGVGHRVNQRLDILLSQFSHCASPLCHRSLTAQMQRTPHVRSHLTFEVEEMKHNHFLEYSNSWTKSFKALKCFRTITIRLSDDGSDRPAKGAILVDHATGGLQIQKCYVGVENVVRGLQRVLGLATVRLVSGDWDERHIIEMDFRPFVKRSLVMISESNELTST